VNWNKSYSLYSELLDEWFTDQVAADWTDLRAQMLQLLQKDAQLQEVVQLVGPDALQDAERLILEVSKMIREDFLQQNAFSEVDAYCSLEKQHGMMTGLIEFYERANEALDRGVSIEEILNLPLREDLSRLKEVRNEIFPKKFSDFRNKLSVALGA
jgi:V/A-type H+-transporting ATPase subunit A